MNYSFFKRFRVKSSIGLLYLLFSAINIDAALPKFVQIDVEVTGGNPMGQESIEIDGESYSLWDTAYSPLFIRPDIRICIENNGSLNCVKDNCPDLNICSFVGVPVSTESFKVKLLDADSSFFMPNPDDLIGEGNCGINRTCQIGQAKITVTPIPCDDKEIQVKYTDGQAGRFLFDSGFKYYPLPLVFHQFDREGKICKTSVKGCDIKTVFSTMISQVYFVAPSTDKTPLKHCKENELVGFNPVRTTVDAKNSTIVNYTLEDHIFHPGKITRRVFKSGEWIVVSTEGEGYGKFATVNEVAGEFVIFAAIDENLAKEVTTKLKKQNKPLKKVVQGKSRKD